MKKIPLIFYPLIGVIIFFILFAVAVPKGRDLISSRGDMILGQLIGFALAICLIIDIRKFVANRKRKIP